MQETETETETETRNRLLHTGLEVLPTVEKWDAAAGVWKEVARMGSPRRDHAVCVHDGLLYVAGGFNGTHVRAHKVPICVCDGV